MKFSSSLLLALAVAAPAAMADNGFYVGAGFGGSRSELDLVDNQLLPEPTFPPNSDTLDNTNFSGSGFTFKGFAGYKFVDFFALELGYVDLGEAEDTFCLVNTLGNCAPQPGLPQTLFNPSNAWVVTASIAGWTVEAVGILPVAERFDLFMKLGLFAWEADLTALDTTVIAPGRVTPVPGLPNQTPVVKDISGNELTFGFGGSFDATEHVSIRAEFQWFDLPFSDTVWTATMSGYYRF